MVRDMVFSGKLNGFIVVLVEEVEFIEYGRIVGLFGGGGDIGGRESSSIW